jgi:serine/threonine-protein kinase
VFSDEFAPGQVVSERYIVRGQLGRGGMARVYEAFDPRLQVDVALKVLPGPMANDPSFLWRFRREAKTLANLTHPHIVRLFDACEEEEKQLYYLVLELLRGGSLGGRLDGRPWSTNDAVALLTPVAEALDHAHAQQPPVIHRDLKPSNILFAQTNRIVVSDFGLARIIGGDQGANPEPSLLSLTLGQVVGTPAYMAPEQANGESPSTSFDVYALGVVAYQLLTGILPFQADTPLATLLQVISKPLPLPSTVNPSIARSTETVLLKALARRPEDRFVTAGELVQALALSLDHERTVMPVTSEPSTPPARDPGGAKASYTRRRPPAVVAGAGAAAIAAAAFGFLLVQFGEDNSTSPAVAAATLLPVLTANPAIAPRLPASLPTSTPAPTRSAVPTAAPTHTQTPTAPLPPTQAPPDEWQRTQVAIDGTWGSDWPRTIEVLNAFRQRQPEHEAARDKLYSALVSYGQSLAEDGKNEEAIRQLTQAQALDASRTEAPDALESLTPTLTPTPIPSSTPMPESAPQRPAVRQPTNPPRLAPPERVAPPEPSAPAPPEAPHAPPPTKTAPFDQPLAPPTKAPFAP